jgi:branched-subunit amino acid transport protein AzlD
VLDCSVMAILTTYGFPTQQLSQSDFGITWRERMPHGMF